MARIIIAREKEEKPKLISSPLHLVLSLVLIVLIVFLVQSFIVKPYTIPSGSMKPTINPGERILVDRFAYQAGEPKVGDIVVFKAPVGEGEKMPCPGGYPDGQACFLPHKEKGDTDYVKRVVAGPGDTVRLDSGRLFVNNKETLSQFLPSCKGKESGACDLPVEIRIPKKHYFVMGDNRGDSFDSRYWGPIPKDWIIGQARVVYWPPNKVGTL